MAGKRQEMRDEAGDDTPEAKKAVFRRLVELYARADLEAMVALIAPDYVGHTAAGPRDWTGFRRSILNFHQLFDYAPDSFIVEDQFADGDRVATRMTAHVRDRASGAPMTMMGINLAVIRGGKIIEEWNTWEMMAPAAQVGDGGTDGGSLSVRGARTAE
ncbi:MAG: nuclear transport factor 2 family protein [Sphingomonadaceae bacterium]|nr:nuclear transport factor 2 family protein [Sphingomonadaceae bacterium]